MRVSPLRSTGSSGRWGLPAAASAPGGGRRRGGGPALMQPQSPLDGVTGQARPEQEGGPGAPPQLLGRLGAGVLIMLVDPKADGVLVGIVFGDVVAQFAGRAVHVEAVFEFVL